MEYRKYADTYYIRMDRGDEIVAELLELCRREHIRSATFSGIGGCSDAQMQIFVPERGGFDTEWLRGVLELVNITGNVITDDDGALFSHTHALYAYMDGGERRLMGGHIKSTAVLYTAEIELRPVRGGAIGRRYDLETGTGFWKFD